MQETFKTFVIALTKANGDNMSLLVIASMEAYRGNLRIFIIFPIEAVRDKKNERDYLRQFKAT